MSASSVLGAKMSPHINQSDFNPLAVSGPLYLEHGPVVPIEFFGKRPAAGFGWKGDAALHSAADLTPHCNSIYNIAVRLDRLFVVDVDGDEGYKSLEKLESQIGPLPRNVVQKSGGGGLHIFFRRPSSATLKLLTNHPDFPKIDFKSGEGHILVMAPSVHASGKQYELLGDLRDAPPVPEGLLQLLTQRPAPAASNNGSNTGKYGERHTLLLRQGVRLFCQGWEKGSIREALWQYTATFHDPWSDDEAAREIDGVMAWLDGLENDRLFPTSSTPVDIANWLKPKIKNDLVHLDNGDWLQRRDHVFGFVRREQIKACLIRHIQPALKDFELWMSHLEEGEGKKSARQKLDRIKSLGWTDRAIDALAASPDLCLKASDLDPPGVLNFKNGPFTIDGDPAPHAICTKQLNVAFDPTAGSAPEFEAFLAWALSREVASTLLDVVGHALLRERNSQYLWLCEGGQAAGKSTLLDLIAEMLGTYAVAPDTSLLFDRKSNAGGANEDLFALRGAAWAAFAEGPEGTPLSPSRCKAMTGGDKLSARPLYGHLVSFENRAEIILVTNHETRMNVDDGGLRRRIKRIVFKNHVSESERDARLKQKLLQEGAAIMNLLLAHARKVRDRGVLIAPEIEADTSSLLDRQDIMQQFIDERLEFVPGATTPGKLIYQAYQHWCAVTGLTAHSAPKFYATFENKGNCLEAYILNGAKAYRGVRVR